MAWFGLMRESEPICRESVALSPGTKLSNRFYGPSACIPRPSYQGKVNQISANRWHFPRDEIRQSLLRPFCLHSSFVLSGESEPICRKSVALSPGTKLGNRFYGHSACILRSSYQGKVNQIYMNLRHFPLENIDSTAIFAVFPGKVNQISANLRHFPA